MKDNSKADVSHTDEFDKMYQEMVKQAEDKYKVKSEHTETEEESTNYSKVIDNDVSNPIIAKTASATIDTDKGFYSYSDSDGNLVMERNLPEGYIFKDENGNVINATKIVLEKKKKEYPKTYEECCKVLESEGRSLLINTDHITDYERDLANRIGKFHKLIVCRYTYWKIYGEEIGLEKPWQPDYKKERYVISRYIDEIVKGYRQAGLIEHFILEFPTEEMRDAFKENFDPDIEFCKEFL